MDGQQSNVVIDNLKKERTNLRRLFTTAANKFQELHSDSQTESKEIDIIYQKLLDKSVRLFNVDFEISKYIELLDEDYDQIESYRDRFTEIKTIYESYLQIRKNDSAGSSTAAGANLKLPKLNLKEYDLMPRTWVAFWGQFSRVHEDDSIREEDKFQYLIASLKSKTKARDIVESYPPSKDNYSKVIEHIKSRFGRQDLLIEVYIRDLLTLVSNRSNVKLSELYDKLGSYLRALETLGVTTQNYAAMLYPVVESCLPIEILKAWDRYRLNREVDTAESIILTKEKLLENLMLFLRYEVEGEEHRVLAESAFGSNVKHKKDCSPSNEKQEPSAAAFLSSVPHQSPKKLSCLFCDKSHPSQDCQKIAGMSYEDRKSKVIRKGCCLVCLKIGHMAKRCHSNVRCLICKRRHLALLCPDLRKNSSKDRTADDEDKSTEALLTNLPAEREIYLKTITLRLRNKSKEVCVRALMDDGSQRSYIEQSLAEELNLSPSGREVFSQGLFGGGISPASEHKRYIVTVESLDSKYATSLSLLDQPKICSALPRIHDRNLLAELASRGIKLTDVGKDTPPIRVLLGADVLGSILTGRIEVLTSGVSAVETSLGWTILGLGRKRQVANLVALSLQNMELPKMWDLEVLGITDPVERKNKILLEEETLTHFKETLKVCDDQRYEVALPWLVGHPALYYMYDIAESRLRTATKRLLNENLFDTYDAVFKQWEAEGIIEAVPKDQITKPGHYLPHRPVIKLSSSTTKVRPVFDASFKKPGFASLNECLSVGPSLIHKILPLLLKFRSGALGVIADIKQAFLQIRLRVEDRDVLRFLWWENAQRTKFKIFRHCRVVFGVSSSPFLLNATINYHLGLQKFQTESLQNTIHILREGFYVDNLVTSVNDVKELEQLKFQAMQIMKEGGFELRCWASNDSKEEQDTQMVLGMRWNVVNDELSCKLPSNLHRTIDEKVTKKLLLSIINSIYDPIGFTAPALLLPKLLLQEAWRKKLGWDDVLPAELEQKYRRWEKTTALLSKCSIPRRIFSGIYDDVTLHIFTDASSFAYATCAFLRCENQGQVTVKLIAAKSRLAPMQKPTIPRLELLGAALGARLAATLHSVLPTPSRTLYWTDSMIVLSWITKKEPWNTFVGNRVKEIRELTIIDDWKHVPGEINPADLATRSCDWSDLLQSQWWEGPSWLYRNEESWPISEISVPNEAFLERRKTVVTNLASENEEKFGDRFLYFSSYPRILRMTAYVLRFCNNIKKNSHKLTNAISCEEIERAEETLIKIIQSEWPSDIREKYSDTIQFSVENGILKVQTRLILSQDPEDFTRPIILPDHPLLERLVLYTHRSLMHAGVLTTLAHLRERFWIPKGRRVVRAALRQCVQCKKLTSRNVNTDPAPLPPDRIHRVAAFQITGADLAGPLFLRGGSKAWIVLFTCAVYRAVHLELVSSLSTEAFMQALRRFWARRGRCSTLYTDNGTNFVGAANALKSLDWDFIQTECSLMKIKWLFSPPSAPWYGGFWERMVRCVKELLRKCLGRACVTYEEMLTLLYDCEATINGRPLTYLSDDPNELKPLTPAHFIQDLKERETVDLDLIDSQHLLKRVRYLHTLRQNLRNRFYKEYLGELIRRPKTASRRKVISPGEIVLVESKNPNRMNWPLAQVIELFPGKDNVERVAKLRVASGEIIRPVQRIYPLELSSVDNLSEDHQETRTTPEDEFSDAEVPKELKTTPEPESSDAEVLKEAKTTRCGRRIVPVNRMNL